MAKMDWSRSKAPAGGYGRASGEPKVEWVKLKGRTYVVRDQLKAMGCQWDGSNWLCPKGRLEAAKRIIG